MIPRQSQGLYHAGPQRGLKAIVGSLGCHESPLTRPPSSATLSQWRGLSCKTLAWATCLLPSEREARRPKFELLPPPRVVSVANRVRGLGHDSRRVRLANLHARNFHAAASPARAGKSAGPMVQLALPALGFPAGHGSATGGLAGLGLALAEFQRHG